MATDPDAADRVGGTIDGAPTVMWSLAGDDAEKFFIYTNDCHLVSADTNPDRRTIAHPTRSTANRPDSHSIDYVR